MAVYAESYDGGGELINCSDRLKCCTYSEQNFRAVSDWMRDRPVPRR